MISSQWNSMNHVMNVFREQSSFWIRDRKMLITCTNMNHIHTQSIVDKNHVMKKRQKNSWKLNGKLLLNLQLKRRGNEKREKMKNCSSKKLHD